MSTETENAQPATDRESEYKPKNIIVLSDGTGNAGGHSQGTNVWRIREAVESDSNAAGVDQVVIYEDGVGTSAYRPIAILGLGFGAGITRDLISLYSRLIQTYRPGDRIYLFGFSRGAFTIRLLAFMLYRCGLANVRRDPNVPNSNCEDQLMRPERIKRVAEDAVASFMLRHTNADKRFRMEYGYEAVELAKSASDTDRGAAFREYVAKRPTEYQGRVPIRFIGVWDTVDAVGLPFDNLSQAWLWVVQKITKLPLEGIWKWIMLRFGIVLLNLARYMPLTANKQDRKNRWKKWGKDDDLHPCIEGAFHALALDDERKTFHPVLWIERKSNGESKTAPQQDSQCPKWLLSDVQQVWFSGVHANVGGGYPKDHLAHVSLVWMMRHARNFGLIFDDGRFEEYRQKRDEFGKLYDSRSGGGVFYRYMPRSVMELSQEVGIGGSSGKDDKHFRPRIHNSVLERIQGSTAAYAPVGAPEPDEYDVVSDPVPSGNVSIENTSVALDENSVTESSWTDNPKKQKDARQFAQRNARRVSDLRLCCYYAFCIWVVTFIATGAYQSSFANADGNSSSFMASASSVAPCNWCVFVSELSSRAYQAICGWYDPVDGPLAEPVMRLFGIDGPCWLVCGLVWIVASAGTVCSVILGITLGILTLVIIVGVLKALFALIDMNESPPSTISADSLSSKPRTRSPLGVLFLSALAAGAAWLIQPLIQEAFLMAAPQAVEPIFNGVASDRWLVSFFALTITVIFLVSRACRTRILEWSVFGWKTSLHRNLKVIGPKPGYWERLGEAWKYDSFQGTFLERIALPVGACGILLTVILAFVAMAISGVQAG